MPHYIDSDLIIPVVLTNTDGDNAAVTGVAANLSVKLCKPSESSFTTLTITTHYTLSEIGLGWYRVTIDDAVVDEAGLYYVEVPESGGTANIFRTVVEVVDATALEATPATLSQTERDNIHDTMMCRDVATAYDSTYGQSQITDGDASNKRRLAWVVALFGGVVAQTAGGFTAKLRSGDAVLATRSYDGTTTTPDVPTDLS